MTAEKRIKTHLICKYASPVYTGDRFLVARHQNICCDHIVECEVKKDKTCSDGFGLFCINTGELIANAGIANDRIEE